MFPSNSSKTQDSNDMDMWSYRRQNSEQSTDSPSPKESLSRQNSEDYKQPLSPKMVNDLSSQFNNLSHQDGDDFLKDATQTPKGSAKSEDSSEIAPGITSSCQASEEGDRAGDHHIHPFPMHEFLSNTGIQFEEAIRPYEPDSIGLTNADLKTLLPTKWVIGKVINAFLKLLGEEIASMLPIPFCQVYEWENACREGRDDDVPSLTKNPFECHWNFIPQFVNSNHWCLIVIDRMKSWIFFLDSGNTSDTIKQERLTFWMLWDQKQREKWPGSNQLTINEVACPKQNDDHSCGPFVLLFAFHIVHGGDVETLAGLTTADAQLFRRYIVLRLLEAYGTHLKGIDYRCSLPNCSLSTCSLPNCSLSNCKQPSATQKRCGRCGWWIHEKEMQEHKCSRSGLSSRLDQQPQASFEGRGTARDRRYKPQDPPQS